MKPSRPTSRINLIATLVLTMNGLAVYAQSAPAPAPTPVPVPAPGATEPLVGKPIKRVIPELNKFTVTRKDENFRQALKRWTTDAGWEFEPEHWAVPRDIPIAGTADFGGDFRAAVRALLKSSELGDQPVQACFYSNKVLRVVPINELCARSSS